MRGPEGRSQTEGVAEQQCIEEVLGELLEFCEKTGREGPLKQTVDSLRGSTAGLSHVGETPYTGFGSSRRDQE